MRSRLLAGVPALLLLASPSACSDDDGDGTARDETSTSESAGESPTATETSEGAPSGEGKACEYTPDGEEATVEPPPAAAAYDGEVQATMTTSIGELGLTLDAERAPCTVNSFLSLAEQGYFDGTPCHRMTVTRGFQVLQCGDPTGTGTGGPGYTIPDELDGQERYLAGTLAMANTGAPDSGGSQFFIVYGDTGLPAAYTVFGSVDEAGIEAIQEAAKAGVDPVNGPEDGTPKTPIEIESVETE
ncbi:peptidylprolyl isomerase [Nocardioides sp. SYSU DS0651]|uniref:peptidylprolyl isomerase n=1 Tax=Nocardioides sp. SYSU DS0651 TaxID=3415955 RepID=UPI003F4C5242